MSLLDTLPTSEELIKSSNENLAISGKKNTFIKAKIMEGHKQWWDTIMEGMTQNEDRELKRLSLIEYNKLQCRLLPTEITGDDGENLTIKVINYAVQNNKTINNVIAGTSEMINSDNGNSDTYSFIPDHLKNDFNDEVIEAEIV